LLLTLKLKKDVWPCGAGVSEETVKSVMAVVGTSIMLAAMV